MPPDEGIGTKLRDARVQRELSIEESAWRTRIRPETLRALEGEEFEVLGHDSFVRSHLSSYARFLGIDPSGIVGAFEARRPGPEPSAIEVLDRQQRGARKPPRAKWPIAAALSAGVLVAAAIVGALGGQGERPTAAATTSPSTAPPVTASPSATAPAVPAAEARVRLRVRVVEPATLSVAADGEQVFEGTLPAGATETFRARRSLDVVVSDAGAVRFTHNGKDLGAPGEPGTIYRARYGPRVRST